MSNGFDRGSLHIQDLLVYGTPPNVGRTQAQRALGTRVHGSGGHERPERSESVARLLYLHDCSPAALRAGLIDTLNDGPFAVMRLGVPYTVSHLVCVSFWGTISDIIDRSRLSPMLFGWMQWLGHQFNRQLQPACRAHEEKLRKAERSRAAQLEADARRFVKGKDQSKGPGKGSHPYARSGQGNYHYR